MSTTRPLPSTASPSFHLPGVRPRWSATLLALAGLASLSVSSDAQVSIPIPNYSFESQSGVGFPFETNPSVDDWVKAPEPSYFAPIGAAEGFSWADTAGVFVGTAPNSSAPYTNLVGSQAGYILGFPGVSLFQDAASSPTFTPTFNLGETYTFTLGVFGVDDGLQSTSALQLSLYYRDTSNTTNDPLGQITPINSTTIQYSTSTFDPSTSTPSLIDYSVSVGPVTAGDAWAGQPIGIMMESVDPNVTGGNWDFDNARLTASPAPEPTTATLTILGLGGLLFRRSRRTSRS